MLRPLRLLSSALPLAATLLLGTSAHAQIVSAYVQSANLHLSNVQTGVTYNGVSAGYTNQFTDFWSSGIGGGVTLNFLPAGPVRVGVDLRGSTKKGTPGADTGMLGVRVAFKPPLLKVKPYLQASGGYLQSRSTNVSTASAGGSIVGGTFTNKYATYEVFGGVDIGVLPFVDLRLEAGGGQGFNVTDIGSANLSNTVALFSLNPGIVVHF